MRVAVLTIKYVFTPTTPTNERILGMNRLFRILLILASVASINSTRAVASASEPSEVTTAFEGTPQWDGTYFNSGTLSLVMDTHGQPFPGSGEVTFYYRDGRTATLRNMWVRDEDVYKWSQWASKDVERVLLDTDDWLIWVGWGPWEPDYSGKGLRLTQPVTEVIPTLVFNHLQRARRQVQWYWKVDVSPDWVAGEMFDYEIVIYTNCEGLGKENGGSFKWQNSGLTEETYSQTLRADKVYSLRSSVKWEILGSDGVVLWSGWTTGPSCRRPVR